MQNPHTRTMPLTECADNEYRAVAWGKMDAFDGIKPMYINRPKVGDYDVKVDYHFCSICHSDVKIGNNYNGMSIYPFVPGHEAVGKVVEVGNKVTKVEVGDTVGVGVVSDACLNCAHCSSGFE